MLLRVVGLTGHCVAPRHAVLARAMVNPMASLRVHVSFTLVLDVDVFSVDAEISCENSQEE